MWSVRVAINNVRVTGFKSSMSVLSVALSSVPLTFCGQTWLAGISKWNIHKCAYIYTVTRYATGHNAVAQGKNTCSLQKCTHLSPVREWEGRRERDREWRDRERIQNTEILFNIEREWERQTDRQTDRQRERERVCVCFLTKVLFRIMFNCVCVCACVHVCVCLICFMVLLDKYLEVLLDKVKLDSHLCHLLLWLGRSEPLCLVQQFVRRISSTFFLPFLVVVFVMFFRVVYYMCTQPAVAQSFLYILTAGDNNNLKKYYFNFKSTSSTEQKNQDFSLIYLKQFSSCAIAKPVWTFSSCRQIDRRRASRIFTEAFTSSAVLLILLILQTYGSFDVMLMNTKDTATVAN